MARIFLLFLLLTLSSCTTDSAMSSNDKPIRIGWITSWATAGQVMEALKRTTAAQDQGLHLELRSYTIGPQMNEAALHGDLDGIVIGVVPTVSLLSVSSDWRVVARLVDFNQALVSADVISLKSPESLRGKRIGVPFGSGAHPFLLVALERFGLAVDEVRLLNMKPMEQILALQGKMVDAVATWEPVTSILRRSQNINILYTQRHSGFLTLRNDLIQRDPQLVEKLLRVFRQAHFYNAQHRAQVDSWYAEDSGFDPAAIKEMEIIESNFSVTSETEVDLRLTREVMTAAQSIANDMRRLDLIKAPVDFQARSFVSP